MTAYHEAGHAVMAHLVGQIVTAVEIVGDEEHSGSVCSLRFGGQPTSGESLAEARTLETRILCLVAGGAAEDILTGERRPRESDGDLDEAARLALRLVEEWHQVVPMLDEARDGAVDVLRNHWEAVEALALRLLVHRRLSGEEVRRLIEAVGRRRPSAISA